MAGPVPVIPIREARRFMDWDGRHRAGHDAEGVIPGRSKAEGKGIHKAAREL
jgi:hypothetical protein